MITKEQAIEYGVEAYVFAYPLVTMEITRRVMTNFPPGARPGMGPENAFSHMRAFPDANFRAVVRPNFDTLYSSAWLDVSEEPIILSIPDSDGRYYLMPMLDMWTDAFAVPGKRTTGSVAGDFAIVADGWQGELPQGVQKIIAPTTTIWIIGRTQTNGPADYGAVNAFQDGLRLSKLSEWPKPLEAKPFVFDPSIDMKKAPLDQVNEMSAREYFTLTAELIRKYPPHRTDWSQVARRRLFGFAPGQPFDWDALTPEMQEGLSAAPATALALMTKRVATMAREANGWQMNTETMGVYGDAYLKRAVVAMAGLGANQPADAIYPLSVRDADGSLYEGAGKYVHHFEKDELPPVDAFWSTTLYDDAGFQVANELSRFAIGDRDALKYNDDGSLDLYYQHERPEEEKVSNWLPTSAGSWNLCMRLYAPHAAALDGRWNPPAVKRVG